MATRSADAMVKILSNPDKRKEVMNDPDPVKKLEETAEEAKKWTIPDTRPYLMIIGALAGVAVAAVIGGIVLVGGEADVPDAVIALGSAAIGALAGALVQKKS